MTTYFPDSQKDQWQENLSILSDAELIEKLNQEVGISAWTSSRAFYLSCLSNEIRKRNFNSNILFEYSTGVATPSLRLKHKVKLVNATLEIAMTTTATKTFTAQVTIGLKKHYSAELIPLKHFKETLLKVQKMVLETHQVALSTKIRHCEILFLGQDEPAIELEFIQYPKFPQEESVLKNAIIELTKRMMLELEQNRVVIVFTDETIMLEQSDAIDPTIKL
jgi:hypothetical protein